jgi:hypothetical protein
MNKLQFIILLIIPIGFIVYLGIIVPDEKRTIIIKEEISIKVINYKRGLSLNDEIKKEKNYIKVVNLLNVETGDRLVTTTILDKALDYEVPVALAFALAWSESRYSPNAINGIYNSNGSKDWGLFQLNDNFLDWTEDEYFNVEKNADMAMSILSNILEKENEVKAIAIYNTGATGVKRGISYTTLTHIDNIINYRDKLLVKINEVMVK